MTFFSRPLSYKINAGGLEGGFSRLDFPQKCVIVDIVESHF